VKPVHPRLRNDGEMSGQMPHDRLGYSECDNGLQRGVEGSEEDGGEESRW
jgi:hypothetical protein